MRYPGGTSLAYGYNGNGFLTEETDPVNDVIYRQITDFDSRGQMKTANVAEYNSTFTYSITNSYYSETGQADTFTVSNGSTVQDLSYTYDVSVANSYSCRNSQLKQTVSIRTTTQLV